MQDDTHEEITRERNGLTFQTLNRVTFKAHRELTSLSCFASNKAMDDRKSTHLKETTTINVKFSPEVLRPNGSAKVFHAVEGEPLLLECQFRANPSKGAHVKWFRNGHSIELPPHPTSHHTNNKSNNLRIEAARATAGLYACSVENEVGRSEIVDLAHVFVEEKPQVAIYFEPRQPVSELADANVTLMCISNYNSKDIMANANAITGNSFVSVKWYLDGDLLKQVDRPLECLKVPNVVNYNVTSAALNNPKCNVDPSKVMLLNVRRSFWGNYSCQAKNRAGWGPVSEAKEMKVLYAPEAASIEYNPKTISKGSSFEVNKQNKLKERSAHALKYECIKNIKAK